MGKRNSHDIILFIHLFKTIEELLWARHLVRYGSSDEQDKHRHSFKELII